MWKLLLAVALCLHCACAASDIVRKCRDPNAKTGCGINCGRHCINVFNPRNNGTGPGICQSLCRVGGCDCNKGYFQDDQQNGKCVTAEECIKPTCPANEEYKLCPPTCPPRTCDLRNIQVKCFAPLKYPDPKCPKPGCQCKDGFYRNSEGSCVTKEQCEPQCKDPNAKTGCGINCGRHCANLFNPRSNATGPAICHALCRVGGCDCNEGFFQDDQQNGKCVTAEECIKPSCPKNEIFKICPSSCPPRNCATRNAEFKCRAPLKYPDPKCNAPACQCKDGFYRNNNGSCVTKQQCACDDSSDQVDSSDSSYSSDYNSNESSDSSSSESTDSSSSDSTTNESTDSNDTTDSSDSTDSTDSTDTTNSSDSTDKPNSTNSSPKSSDSSGESNVDTEKAMQKFSNGIAKFNGNFYAQESKDQAGTSTIMSPYSLLFLLAQLALYATGDTLTQLLAALGLDSKEEIRVVIPKAIDSIEAVVNVTLDLAIKTYSNKDFELSQSFKDDTRVVFRAEAQALDCSKPAEAAGIVNAWVANKTNNKIPSILSPDSISSLTRLILTDAIYFKGNWKQQFDKKLTKNQDFTLKNNQVTQVKTMYAEGNYRHGYSDELNCEALEMLYDNEDFSMTIYLPQVGGLAALQEKMRNSTLTTNLRKNMNKQKIQIYIPTFKIDTTINLVELLQNIGITGMFNKVNSGLNGLLAKPEDVYVSDAIQKATIEVNEEGAEATAANVVVVSTRAAVQVPYIFRANHGFVYEIRSREDIIFLGTYVGS